MPTAQHSWCATAAVPQSRRAHAAAARRSQDVREHDALERAAERQRARVVRRRRHVAGDRASPCKPERSETPARHSAIVGRDVDERQVAHHRVKAAWSPKPTPTTTSAAWSAPLPCGPRSSAKCRTDPRTKRSVTTRGNGASGTPCTHPKPGTSKSVTPCALTTASGSKRRRSEAHGTFAAYCRFWLPPAEHTFVTMALLLPASAFGQMVSGIYYSGSPGTQCSDCRRGRHRDGTDVPKGDQFVFCLSAHHNCANSGPKGCSYFMGSAQLNMGTGDSLSNRNAVRHGVAPRTTSPSFLPRPVRGRTIDARDALHLHDAGRGRGRVHRRGLQWLGVGGGVGGAVRPSAHRRRGGGGGTPTGTMGPYELAAVGLTCADIGRAEVVDEDDRDAAAVYLQGVNGAQGADGIPDVESGFLGGTQYTLCFKWVSTGTPHYQPLSTLSAGTTHRALCGAPLTDVQTAPEPCLIARTGSNSGWNCYATWWSDRDTGTGSWFMRPDQTRRKLRQRGGMTDRLCRRRRRLHRLPRLSRLSAARRRARRRRRRRRRRAVTITVGYGMRGRGGLRV